MKRDRHPSAMILAFAAATALIAYSSAARSQSSDRPAVRVLNASPYAIAADETLSTFVQTTAEAAIEEHCVQCHGETLEGKPGVPNIVDFDWMWGITGFESNSVEPVRAIEQTLLYGIRNRDCPEDQMSYGACSDTRYSEMPAYGQLGFTEEQIDDLVEWVVDLSGGEADAAAVARAEPIKSICAECHGEDSFGHVPYGGPALVDDIWVYGGDRATIKDVIANGRLGQCPPWGNVLDAATIKAIAVYVWNRASGG